MTGRGVATAAGEVATVGVLGGDNGCRTKRNTPTPIRATTKSRTRRPILLWKSLLCGSARLLGRFIWLSPGRRSLGQRVGGRDEIGLDGLVQVPLVKSLQPKLGDVHQPGQIGNLAEERAGAVEAAGYRDLDGVFREVGLPRGLRRLEEQELHARLLPGHRDLAEQARDFLLCPQELPGHLP